MKRLIMMLLLVGFSSYAFGQAQFALGLKAGPNFANINTDGSTGDNYQNRIGLHGGAFALIKLTKLGIQPEIIFSQQGSTVRFSGEDFQQTLNYVNIPLIFKLYTVAGINLQAGPQFGFITKAESEVADPFTNNIMTVDIEDQVKNSDLSLSLGAGWDLPFGLTLDFRYNMGLTKINDTSSSDDARHQVFQLSLGYKLIQLGK